MCAVAFPVVLPIYLLASFVVVAFEGSGHYVEAAVATVVAALALSYVFLFPGTAGFASRSSGRQGTRSIGRRP